MNLGSCPSIINSSLIVCKCLCHLTWQCFISHSCHLVYPSVCTFLDTIFSLKHPFISIDSHVMRRALNLILSFIALFTSYSLSVHLPCPITRHIPLIARPSTLQRHCYDPLWKVLSHSKVIHPAKQQMSRVLYQVPLSNNWLPCSSLAPALSNL